MCFLKFPSPCRIGQHPDGLWVEVTYDSSELKHLRANVLSSGFFLSCHRCVEAKYSIGIAVKCECLMSLIHCLERSCPGKLLESPEYLTPFVLSTEFSVHLHECSIHIHTHSHIAYWIPVNTFPHTSKTQYFQTKFIMSSPKPMDVTVGGSLSSSFPSQQEHLFSIVISLSPLHIQSVTTSHLKTVWKLLNIWSLLFLLLFQILKLAFALSAKGL